MWNLWPQGSWWRKNTKGKKKQEWWVMNQYTPMNKSYKRKKISCLFPYLPLDIAILIVGATNGTRFAAWIVRLQYLINQFPLLNPSFPGFQKTNRTSESVKSRHFGGEKKRRDMHTWLDVSGTWPRALWRSIFSESLCLQTPVFPSFAMLPLPCQTSRLSCLAFWGGKGGRGWRRKGREGKV